MSLPLNTFVEGSIYLDTMIFYIFLRAEPKIHPIIGEFFKKIEEGRITAYTSALTFDELAYRLLLGLIKDHYSGSPLERLRDAEQAIIQEFYPLLVPQLQLLRGFPNLHIIDVTAEDLEAMMQNMLDHYLKPRDALHLSAMHKVGCRNVASNDQHFDAIPDIKRFAISPQGC